MSSSTIEHKANEHFHLKLRSVINDRFSGLNTAQVEDFASHYYNFADLKDKKVEDLSAAICWWWDFIQFFDSHNQKIHIYNPTLENDGWERSQTVIALIHKDMPFLVESIRLVLNRKNIGIHHLKSTPLGIRRDTNNNYLSITPNIANKEALIHIEIDHKTDLKELDEIKQGISKVLSMLQSVSDDGTQIQNLAHMAARKKNSPASIAAIDKPSHEHPELLNWINNDRFIFLGYCQYSYIAENKGTLRQEHTDQRLGVVKTHPDDFEFINDGKQLVHHSPQKKDSIWFSKSVVKSSIHKDVQYDIIHIKNSQQTGEQCYIGLFTNKAINTSPYEIPWLRQKLNQVIALSDVTASSHNGRRLLNIIESYPRDELLQCDGQSLFRSVSSISMVYDQKNVKLLTRHTQDKTFTHCIVYIPMESYSTQMGVKIQQLLANELQSDVINIDANLSDSLLARYYLSFYNNKHSKFNIDTLKIEHDILLLTHTWEDQLLKSLINVNGEEIGASQYLQYKTAFPTNYRDVFDPRSAVNDINTIADLSNNSALAINFYHQAESDDKSLRLKLFNLHKRLELSAVIPILENLGFRVRGEEPYKIRLADNIVWLHDFELIFEESSSIDIVLARQYFQSAFMAVWNGSAESDNFNRLVLNARLHWREVSLLRAYASYLKQIQFTFDKESIANTLSYHPKVTRNLIALFKTYFQPHSERDNSNRIERLNEQISQAIESVDNLNEDLILRRFQCLINATIRTNFFQSDSEGNHKPCLALKIRPNDIPSMPSPKPEYEIYIYSPELEGTHLRGGKISRGGLRWSDRIEDYRTEVLGLVKAQQVKNSVIVPQGAKGGFVIKKFDSGVDVSTTAEARYKTYIGGLLDITDNICDNKIVRPNNTIVRDDYDPYLVVAADKGTSQFSDIANEVAASYNFWLGDAFASGGSQGYDHKAMGITAKGAWVAVQRHFLEMNIDIQSQRTSVVGIGDMGGDVFGNGMLMSKHIALVGAFNHQHIFLDPCPDCEKSYVERERLFKLPRSNWKNYNQNLLSQGGAIYSRSSKKLKLSPEIQQLLGISNETLTPDELISCLLKASVDLIWNGGIGTYIKASSETHIQAGDKANDSVRVNAKQLNCKVLGEGGNLGITQQARIEYCLGGGICNTDFIDNAAGVDCSDHEVNIKILLDDEVKKGHLKSEQRNNLLETMTDEVSKLVLDNNYSQALAISLASDDCSRRPDDYIRFINHLEATGALSRELEDIPSNSEIGKRSGQGGILTRPELAVLISYAKVTIKNEMVNSNLPQMDQINSMAESAFPPGLRINYKNNINQHRLYRELISTQITNDMINSMGINFCHRMWELTGKPLREIALAYLIARDIWNLPHFWQQLKKLDFIVEHKIQVKLARNMTEQVEQFIYGLLTHKSALLMCDDDIESYKQALDDLTILTPELLSSEQKQTWKKHYDSLITHNVPHELAMQASGFNHIQSPLSLIRAANKHTIPLQNIICAAYQLEEKLNLRWLYKQFDEKQQLDHWQQMNRGFERDALNKCVSSLSIEICWLSRNNETLGIDIHNWAEGYTEAISRWSLTSNEFTDQQINNYSLQSMAIRDLEQFTESIVVIN